MTNPQIICARQIQQSGIEVGDMYILLSHLARHVAQARGPRYDHRHPVTAGMGIALVETKRRVGSHPPATRIVRHARGPADDIQGGKVPIDRVGRLLVIEHAQRVEILRRPEHLSLARGAIVRRHETGESLYIEDIAMLPKYRRHLPQVIRRFGVEARSHFTGSSVEAHSVERRLPALAPTIPPSSPAGGTPSPGTSRPGGVADGRSRATWSAAADSRLERAGADSGGDAGRAAR